MSPAVRWLEARRVGRGLGIAIVFTVFFISAILLVALTIPTLVSQTVALLEREPALRGELADQLAGSPLSAPLADWLRGLKPDALTNAIGALLALPVAAAAMMLIQELRVELPGEQEQFADRQVRRAADRAEAEYERRTEGVGAEAAAAIAVGISVDRRKEENHE